jgi:serine/threonine protein kinase
MVLSNDVFLEKSESMRTTKFIGNFPGHEDYSILPDDVARKVVKYANKRLKKALIDESYIEKCETNVGWLRHTQLCLGSCVGTGSFSSVYEVTSITSPDRRIHRTNDVVVKVLRPEITARPDVLAACAADLVKEGALMSSLNHENIMSVRAWTPTGLSGFRSGRADAFFLVLDRLKDTLSERLKQWSHESRKLKYAFKQRCQRKTAFLQERLDVLLKLGGAVKYLHSKGILHRDLKPDNIGFDQKGVLKVYDFDVSRIMPESSRPDETFALTKKVGSFRYMSPECAKGEEYNLKADVYSFGLLCHEVISLGKPYEDILPEEHHEMVFYQEHRPWIPASWTQGISSLIRCCWSENIVSRPTIDDAHSILEQEIPLMIAKKEVKYSKSWFSSGANSQEAQQKQFAQISEDTSRCSDEMKVEQGVGIMLY